MMHPSLVLAHVNASVTDLRLRLERRAEADVVDIMFDDGRLELDLVLDHQEHETAVVGVQSPLLLPGGSPVEPRRIPIIGSSNTRRLILRFGLDGFDLIPPTATLLRESGEPLPADEWPTSFAGGGIVDGHPIYGRPFFCHRGLREYHTHPQHEDDPWARWREGLSLSDIVIELVDGLRVRWHGAA